MKYERQKELAQELDARIPRARGRSEHSLYQNIFRAEVNARCLHGEPMEEAIGRATVRIRASHFPDFVPLILPPQP
jgi:hypothetical protein